MKSTSSSRTVVPLSMEVRSPPSQQLVGRGTSRELIVRVPPARRWDVAAPCRTGAGGGGSNPQGREPTGTETTTRCCWPVRGLKSRVAIHFEDARRSRSVTSDHSRERLDESRPVRADRCTEEVLCEVVANERKHRDCG